MTTMEMPREGKLDAGGQDSWGFENASWGGLSEKVRHLWKDLEDMKG